MRELVNKKIDGIEYNFGQFGANKSLKLLVRLSKIAGEPLALAFASAEGTGSLLEKKINPAMLGNAVKVLFDKLDETDALELIQGLTSKDSCLCEGKQIDFNLHYEGRLPHMFKVLYAALEVQYGNFFDALTDLSAMSKQATTSVPAT